MRMESTDSTSTSTSPRKKIKLEHHNSINTIMAESTTPQFENKADPPLDQNCEHLSNEARCGITELVSPELAGFTGILKKRYTDFLVNEILPSGVVVHLDNLGNPRKGKQVAAHDVAEATPSAAIGTDAGQDLNSLDEHDNKGNRSALSSKDVSPQLDESSHIVKADGKNLPPHLRAILQGPIEKQQLQEPAPVRRTKYKVLLVGTMNAWVEVDPKDPLALPVDASDSASLVGQGKDTEISTQPSSKIEEAGNGSENGEVKQPRAEPVVTSVADWQAFAGAFAGAPQGFQLKLEDKELLRSFFDSETVTSTVALYNRVLKSSLRKSKDYGIVRSAPITDRDIRTKTHHAIRRIFHSRLETSTDGDRAMVISATPPKSDWTARAPVNGTHRAKTSHQKGKSGWQELGGEYLHFTLYKENKDTMEVIAHLARSLKMKAQAFQFAGTKDRRGVTVQRVSVFRVFVDRMMSVAHLLRGAKIGNFDYEPSGLQLGQLTGNEFVITLRDCQFGDDVNLKDRTDHASQVVSFAVEKFKQNGFLNYYGLQRFGTFSTRTDTVGVAMLQGDFEAAVNAILHFSPTSLAAAQHPALDDEKISADDRARAYALDIFRRTGKTQPALTHLPRKFSAEAAIIRHLGGENRGRDYYGALQTISRNLRLMYVHAYQSLVWNVAASERWKLFGPRVIEGDLVLISEHKDKMKDAARPINIDADGEVIVEPGEDDRAVNPVDIFARAKALTENDVNSGAYSIFDVVLSTPGYDILYPANKMLDVYKEFMASERGGGLDPLDMHRKWKDVNLSGSYRKLLARPGKDLSFEIKTYQEENEQFVQTDLDLLQQQQQIRINTSTSRDGDDVKNDDNGDNDDRNVIRAQLDVKKQELSAEQASEGGSGSVAPASATATTKLAVILKLQLGASQYATMALRELMKTGGVQTYKPDFGGGR